MNSINNSNNSGKVYFKNYHNREKFQEYLVKKHQELKEAGYFVMQQNGQRIVRPGKLRITPPGKGTEVFVGKIPRSMIENDLIELFAPIGKIYQIRIMIGFDGFNRGFAFITYATVEEANMAIYYMDKFAIAPNRQIGVYKSVDNRRLFIGGLPEYKTKEELKITLDKFVDGVADIIMYPPKVPNQAGCVNRGYVFVEFRDHRMAAMARRLLGSGISLWDDEDAITVDWADPIPEVDQRVLQTVKRLYIRNLPPNMSNEELWKFLTDYVHSDKISRVHKINDYAFIHFLTREDAEAVLRMLNGIRISDRIVEVMWSRPRVYSKEYRLKLPMQNFCKSVPPKMRRKIHEMKSDDPEISPLNSGVSSPTSSSSGGTLTSI